MAKSTNPLNGINQDTAPRLIAITLFLATGIWLFTQTTLANALITVFGIGTALALLIWRETKSQQTLKRELTQISQSLASLLPAGTNAVGNDKNLASDIHAQLQTLSHSQIERSTNASGMADQVYQAQQAASLVANELAQQQHSSQSANGSLENLRHALGQLLDSADETLEISKRSENDGESGKLAMTEAMSGVMALGESVNETGTKVDKLGENSEAIGNIVNVIKSVAEQTNLLALNAAIEAARAGEQGRGFAVVADEVRSLATKTQDSAQEIEELIQQLLRNVESANASIHNSIKLSERSDELIEGMVVSYSELVGHMVEIENLAKSMSSVSAQGQQSTQDISELLHQLDNGLANAQEQFNQFEAASQSLIAQASN